MEVYFESRFSIAAAMHSERYIFQVGNAFGSVWKITEKMLHLNALGNFGKLVLKRLEAWK